MSDIVKFPTRVGAPPEILIYKCRCGCQSFELRSDGTTECCHCGSISTNADASVDEGWFKLKPPVPTEAKVPEKEPMKVTRIGNTGAALRLVTAEANDGDTAYVVVVNNDGHTYVWKGKEYDDSQSVSWLDETLAGARRLILPEGVPPNDLDTMRAAITSSLEIAHVIALRRDGDVKTWTSAYCTIEPGVDLQRTAWLDRKLAIARELILDEPAKDVPPSYPAKDSAEAKVDEK